MKTHQFLICSYAKDFQFLEPNLRSLKRFSSGFLPPTICVDGSDYGECKKLVARIFPEAAISVKDGRRGLGMARAMISMMCGDLICPAADVVHLLGSDCMAYKTLTPQQYCWSDGRPILLWNTYREISGPGDGGVSAWQRGTERLLGFPTPKEYMRRLPIPYPKELFAPFRRFLETKHRTEFENLIYAECAARHPVSESNLMGGFAEKYMPEVYKWLHASPSDSDYVAYRTKDADSIIQWFSHGGLNRPAETNVEYLPGKWTGGRTPHSVMQELALI